MKVNKFEDGFEVNAKDVNHYVRVFFYNSIFYTVPILTFAFILYDRSTFIIALIALFLGNVIGFLADRYYLVNLIIKNDILHAIYYPLNKREVIDCNLLDLNFILTKESSGVGVYKKIVVNKNKKMLFEIRPHNTLLFREYRDDDIVEIYNLLVEYQNKLKLKVENDEEKH